LRRALLGLFTSIAILTVGIGAATPAGATASTVRSASACANYAFQHVWGPDSQINPGECFAIDTGELWMQNDGNLVLYRYGQEACSSDSAGWDGAYAYLQYDGNLVIIYNGRPIKESRTAGNYEARLILRSNFFQTVGRLDIRATSGSTVWSICNQGFFDVN
jgi:hypothetical protein